MPADTRNSTQQPLCLTTLYCSSLCASCPEPKLMCVTFHACWPTLMNSNFSSFLSYEITASEKAVLCSLNKQGINRERNEIKILARGLFDKHCLCLLWDICVCYLQCCPWAKLDAIGAVSLFWWLTFDQLPSWIEPSGRTLFSKFLKAASLVPVKCHMGFVVL